MEHTNRVHRKMISIVEILQFMTHDSLLLYKKKHSNAPMEQLVAYSKQDQPHRKGVVFVSPSKADLTEGKGYVVTSYETLREKHQQLSHWTPNTYRGGTYYDFANRKIKGHTRENLKQINVIGFDIDSKNVDIYGLYLGCEELGLPRPNLLLETPRGYQVFFVLETPFYIHKQGDYKSLRVAERLSRNIRKALATFAPIDTNCVPFGFFRMPNEDNVLDFYSEAATTSELVAWSKQYEAKHTPLHVVYGGDDASDVDYVSSEWYRALLSTPDIDKGHYSASRNNTLFTLALANYASKRAFDVAYDELDEFNSRLHAPLTKNEFEKIMNSAYSGKYDGVKREYAEGILELWTDGNAPFHGKKGWYKFKKNREDRERSHYDEREEDILAYLNTHQSLKNPFLKASLSVLAKQLGMALSTLKEVLKRSRRLVVKSVGRGRKAYTKVTSRKLYAQHVLYLRKQNKQVAQKALHAMLGERQEDMLEPLSIGRVIITRDVPIYQLEHMPAIRNTS